MALRGKNKVFRLIHKHGVFLGKRGLERFFITYITASPESIGEAQPHKTFLQRDATVVAVSAAV